MVRNDWSRRARALRKLVMTNCPKLGSTAENCVVRSCAATMAATDMPLILGTACARVSVRAAGCHRPLFELNFACGNVLPWRERDISSHAELRIDNVLYPVGESGFMWVLRTGKPVANAAIEPNLKSLGLSGRVFCNVVGPGRDRLSAQCYLFLTAGLATLAVTGANAAFFRNGERRRRGAADALVRQCGHR